MPRVAKELSPLEVRRLAHPGKGRNVVYQVGGVSGLGLQITPTNGRTWLLRIAVGGKRREIGLGGFPDVTLAQARERAREAKDAIRQGIDPIEQRKVARAALLVARQRGLTFSGAAKQFLTVKEKEFRNDKHRAQWHSTLQTYAMPELGRLPVSEIQTSDVLRVLAPIWHEKTETASRVRQRIEAVLSWATVSGHRTGENPGRWTGNLKELLPAPAKIAGKGNHPALAIDDAPQWFAELGAREGMGSRALEFLALTAVRSGGVRGAVWSEIDLERGLWTIPADRMKMSREHRVPLSYAAIDLLEALPRLEGNNLVFPALRGGQLSDMTLSATMKRIHEAACAELGPHRVEGEGGYLDIQNKRPAVPHGLRSTFRDWVAERTDYPGDMAEVALAHQINSSVEAAYRRGDMVEKRRQMMSDWAAFLNGEDGLVSYIFKPRR